MAKKRKTDSKLAQNRDQKLVEPHAYLETQRAHEKWYNIHEMGRQKGRPRLVPREAKKMAGVRKHSLRKGK